MGIYLSKPETTIEAEEGSADGIRYGVADMQVRCKALERSALQTPPPHTTPRLETPSQPQGAILRVEVSR